MIALPPQRAEVVAEQFVGAVYQVEFHFIFFCVRVNGLR